jgi:hypothetical protein
MRGKDEKTRGVWLHEWSKNSKGNIPGYKGTASKDDICWMCSHHNVMWQSGFSPDKVIIFSVD